VLGATSISVSRERLTTCQYVLQWRITTVRGQLIPVRGQGVRGQVGTCPRTVSGFYYGAGIFVTPSSPDPREQSENIVYTQHVVF
jgi:hypothetical protein